MHSVHGDSIPSSRRSPLHSLGWLDAQETERKQPWRGKRGHGRQSWRSCLRIADPWRSCLRIADPGRANEPASNARPLRTTDHWLTAEVVAFWICGSGVTQVRHSFLSFEIPGHKMPFSRLSFIRNFAFGNTCLPSALSPPQRYKPRQKETELGTRRYPLF